MQSIRGGDANDVHVLIGKQILVLGVYFGAGGLCGLFASMPICIANGDNSGFLPRFNKLLHGGNMAAASPANADKTNSELFVCA
jgi:hypothetical protein